MKTLTKFTLTIILLLLFSYTSHSQVSVDVGRDLYVCTGDSVVLPRVRVTSPGCNTSVNQLSPPCVYLLILYPPMCGCDQLNYSYPAIGAGTGTPGICPSQIANWSGGNGGSFTSFAPSETASGTAYHPTALDYANGVSTLVFTSGGTTDTLKVFYTSGVDLGPDKVICDYSSGFQLSVSQFGNPSEYQNIQLEGWSNGLGTFNPNNLKSAAKYTPSSGEIVAGFVDLYYTDVEITGNCKTDTIRYFLNPLASSLSVEAGANIIGCTFGSTINLNGTGSGFNQISWNGLGTFSNSNVLSTSYSPHITEINEGRGTVYLTGIDNNGCTLTDTLNFTLTSKVDILDNIPFFYYPYYPYNIKEILTCASGALGNSVNLSAAVTGLSNGITWTTSGSGTFSNTTSLSTIYTFSPQDVQNQQVKVYIQNSGCNSSIDSLKILLNVSSNASASFGNLPTIGNCTSTYTFPVNISGTWSYYNNFCYKVVQLDGVTINPNLATDQYTIGPLTPGVHLIQVYGQCNNLIGTHQITIPNPSIAFNAASNATICEGDQIALYGQGGTNYSWSGGISNGVAFTPPGPGTYTYTLTGINNCGIPSIDSAIITVVQSPQQDITINNLSGDVCLGEEICLEIITQNLSSYNYYSQGSFIIFPSTGTVSSPQVNGVMVDTICFATSNWFSPFNQPLTTYFEVQGGSGVCYVNEGIVLTANPTPYVFVNDVFGCEGDTVILSASSTSINDTITWENGMSNGDMLVLTGPESILVTATNIYSCTSEDSMEIYIFPDPIINAGPDINICEGNSVTLNATGNGFQYLWSNGILNGTSFIPVASDTLVVSSDTLSQCTNTDTLVVNVNPIPIVDVGPNLTICEGDTLLLFFNGNGNQVNWSNGITNGDTFNPTSNQTLVVTSTSSFSCSGSDTLDVFVNPTPTINAGPDISICEGDSIELNATGTGNQITWSNGVSNGTYISPNISDTLIVSTTNTQLCTSSDSLLITVFDNPIVNAGPDIVLCEGDTAFLNGAGAPTLNWSNNILNNSSFVPNQSETIILTGVSVEGCVGSDTLNLTVNPNTSDVQSDTSVGNYTWAVNGQTYSQSGTYSAIIPNQYGCDSTITLNLIIFSNSLNEVTQDRIVELFPNPNNGTFTLSVSNDFIGEMYSIFSLDGTKIKTNRIVQNVNEILLDRSISTGVYLLKIQDQTIRMIVNNNL
jgi:hypothetical protein